MADVTYECPSGPAAAVYAASEGLETSLPGVFAAGDVRHRSTKRVAAAVGKGSTAVQLIHDYLSKGDASTSMT